MRDHSPVFLTNRDNNLTNRDLNLVVRTSGLTGYEPLMRTLGVEPASVLLRYGIEPSTLADSEAFVSLVATLNLMEESAALTQCPDFGLRLANLQDSGTLGLLAVVIQNAPTIAQAIIDASRYLFLHSPAFEVVLDEQSPLFNDCSFLRFEIRLPEHIQQRQTLDACIGFMYKLANLLVDSDLSLRAVSLTHSSLARENNYRKFFGVPVYFSQPHSGLHAHKNSLNHLIKSVNPAIRQLALNYISQQFSLPTLGLSDRVRQALIRTLGANHGTKTEISQLMNMHPRTLQRQLKEEEITFEAIREEVYKNATLRYLRDTTIPLKQLAGALGFSEQSALSRACERWFNQSPSQIRTKSHHR